LVCVSTSRWSAARFVRLCEAVFVRFALALGGELRLLAAVRAFRRLSFLRRPPSFTLRRTAFALSGALLAFAGLFRGSALRFACTASPPIIASTTTAAPATCRTPARTRPAAAAPPASADWPHPFQIEDHE